MSDMRHMKHLGTVASSDVTELERKESTYKGSWKKRGGVGCWMMLARKMDRLDNMLERDGGAHRDIFATILSEGAGGEDGTVLAEVRDLRRYLLLVEAEIVALRRGARSSEEAEKPAFISTELQPRVKSPSLLDGTERKTLWRPPDAWPGGPSDPIRAAENALLNMLTTLQTEVGRLGALARADPDAYRRWRDVSSLMKQVEEIVAPEGV